MVRVDSGSSELHSNAFSVFPIPVSHGGPCPVVAFLGVGARVKPVASLTLLFVRPRVWHELGELSGDAVPVPVVDSAVDGDGEPPFSKEGKEENGAE